MTVTAAFLSMLRKRGVRVWAEDDRRCYRALAQRLDERRGPLPHAHVVVSRQVECVRIVEVHELGLPPGNCAIRQIDEAAKAFARAFRRSSVHESRQGRTGW